MSLPANHRQHVGSDGTLTVRNVDRYHDQGEYRCDARNSQKQGMDQGVHVNIMGKPIQNHNIKEQLIHLKLDSWV